MLRTIRNGCNRWEHVSRRDFLMGAGAWLGGMGLGRLASAEVSQQLAQRQKHVVLFWQSGGVSQFESWDPKPETEYGGPFAAIPTSVPGVRVCELLPHTAKQMHHLALIRSIHTNENDHGLASYMMQRGQPKRLGFEYPHLGSAMAALLHPRDSQLPGFVGGGGTGAAAFLGPRHAPVKVATVAKMLDLPRDVSQADDQRRRALLDRLNAEFRQGRRPEKIDAYATAFQNAAKLMARKDVFQIDDISEKDLQRYGASRFARECIQARMLIERGITFVQVDHSNYDSHAINFDTHIRLLGEFDRPFAAFVEDLADRGLLEHTLVIVMGEFGRTPKINARMGRDHWGKCWSIALGGCGIPGGAVVGKTDAKGVEVVDRMVYPGHLFHTFYKAVGIDGREEWYHNDRPIDRADPKTEPISELVG
jgi:hypothetical protein